MILVEERALYSVLDVMVQGFGVGITIKHVTSAEVKERNDVMIVTEGVIEEVVQFVMEEVRYHNRLVINS